MLSSLWLLLSALLSFKEKSSLSSEVSQTAAGPSQGSKESHAAKRAQVESLYREYGYLLKRRCRRILRDDVLVEDAMQEICVTLCRSLDQYQGEPRKIIGWLYRIATTHCLQLLGKDKRRWKHIAQEIVPYLDEIAAPAAQDIESQLSLSQFLTSLPEDEREAISYYYLCGMAQEEIAEIMNVSRDQIRTWLKHFQARGQVVLREHRT